jgi:transposase
MSRKHQSTKTSAFRPKDPDDTAAITREVLRFVLANRDVVSTHHGRRYTETFKCFIVDLYKHNNSLGLSTFASAVTIGQRTLQIWMSDNSLQRSTSDRRNEVQPSRADRVLQGTPETDHADGRSWKTRPDSFAKVWSDIRLQLQVTPRVSSRAILDSLMKKHPGRFVDGQLRSLQRRVKAWRRLCCEDGKLSVIIEDDQRVWISDVRNGGKSAESLQWELGPIPDLQFLVTCAGGAGSKLQMKAIAVLCKYKGMDDAIISAILGLSPTTIMSYFETFRRFGIRRLFGTRPISTATTLPRATKDLLTLIHQKPSEFGINRTSWTLGSLANVFEKQHGVTISKSSVCRYIRKAGYEWSKAKRVLTSPDPDYRKKVELLLRILHSVSVNEEFFFVDEWGPLLVQKRGGATYCLKKHTPICPRRQSPKGSVALVGALSATRNQMTWVYGASKDTALMTELIELLFNEHRDKSRLYITWDDVSWHSSNGLNEWLDEFNKATRRSESTERGPIIELVPLPTSAQFLNVIEGVFSGAGRAVIHNSDYQSENEMKFAISLHFAERNEYFRENPKRAGKRIWESDFFHDYDNLRSGNYRDY